MKATQLQTYIQKGDFDANLSHLYGENKLTEARKRFDSAISEFIKLYGDLDAELFSVPGRTEVSGNHTDHNHGCVLAASLDIDIIAVATKTEKNEIRIKSEGFSEDLVDISDLNPDRFKKYSSSAIIAGICDGFAKRNYKYSGFTAYTTSNVLKGSGLSSSAAFEVQVCNILNHFYNSGKIDAPELAKISQYSENVFFGKPCGLMDQTACAVGGFVAIDFAEPQKPLIEKLEFDLTDAGYCLCIIDTGGNHADLNEDYASVSSEMKKVASFFNKEVLRGISYGDILEKIPQLREFAGDRAVLRSLHFIEENERVLKQKAALKDGNTAEFLKGVLNSGDSSFRQLQNIYTIKNVHEQGLSLALALCKHFLADKNGAWRVHGGGFAGTVQAFVPSYYKDTFKAEMDKVFGVGACAILNIRAEGAIKFEI